MRFTEGASSCRLIPCTSSVICVSAGCEQRPVLERRLARLHKLEVGCERSAGRGRAQIGFRVRRGARQSLGQRVP